MKQAGSKKRALPQEAKEAAPEQDGLQQLDAAPLDFLLAPKALPKFLEEHWEKKPLHIKANDSRKKLFDGLFDIDALINLADRLEAGEFEDEGLGPLEFGRDINAARYVDGKRETPNGEHFADSNTIRELHSEQGATFQLLQPQRFVEPLWRLLAALEAQLGCLMGCNAYITPAGSQGLAPHHDDVELFVCQTKGSKRWRLYKPLHGIELPTRSSGDLLEADIGEPTLEVVLQPGDVLYLPRGTVHQAVAQEGGSCHLTISTYQRWCYGELAAQVLRVALDGSSSLEGEDQGGSSLPLALRRGLPLGHIFKAGLQVDAALEPGQEANKELAVAAAGLAAGLRKLADDLEKGGEQINATVSAATDALAADFLRNRLPPHPAQLPDPGPQPGPKDGLACRGRNLFRMVAMEGPESDCDSDDDSDEDEEEEGEEEEEEEKGGKAGKKEKAEAEGGAKKKAKGKGAEEEEDEDEEESDEEEHEGAWVKVVTCLENRRATHMMRVHDPSLDPRLMGMLGGQGHDHGCGDAACRDPHCGDSSEGVGEEAAAASEEKEKGGKHAHAHGKGKGGKKGEEEEEGGKAAADKKGKGAAGKTGEPEGKEEDNDGMEIIEVGSDDESDDDEHGHHHHHHGHPAELPGPMFPALYAVAIAQVLAATPEKPVAVRALPVPGLEEGEQVRLAETLWQLGIVVTVPAGSGAAAEKGKGSGKKGAEKGAEKGEKPVAKKAKK